MRSDVSILRVLIPSERGGFLPPSQPENPNDTEKRVGDIAFERIATPFPRDDMQEWENFVPNLNTRRAPVVVLFENDDSRHEYTPVSEWGTMATEPTSNVFLPRRSFSAPPKQSFVSKESTQSNCCEEPTQESIELEKINREFIEIDIKSSDIIKSLQAPLLEIVSLDDDNADAYSDINFYPLQEIPTPPLHRRSCSKPEFTHQESMLRAALWMDSKKRNFQDDVIKFLTNLVEFAKNCKDLEKVKCVSAFIEEIDLLDKKCFIDPRCVDKAVKKSRFLTDEILGNDSNEIAHQELYDIAEEYSETGSNEDVECVLYLNGEKYTHNFYETPVMSESSESEPNEDITDLSDDGDYLDSPNFQENSSVVLTNFDRVSKRYLSEIVESVLKDKKIDKLCDTLLFLRGLKELNDKKVELGENSFLDLNALEYMKSAIASLENKLKAKVSIEYLSRKTRDIKEVCKMSDALKLLNDLKELNDKKVEQEEVELFDKGTLNYIKEKIGHLAEVFNSIELYSGED